MNRKSGAALEAAAACGNIEVIDLLLQHGAVLEWSMPLHAALFNWDQNRPAFVHLLQLGADPNRNTDIRYGSVWVMGTPLLWAFRNGNWDAVELLLESGANPPAVVQSSYEMTKLMAIVEKVKEKRSSST